MLLIVAVSVGGEELAVMVVDFRLFHLWSGEGVGQVVEMRSVHDHSFP